MVKITIVVFAITASRAMRLKHLFDDEDVFAYSNLVADGLNINVLD